MDKEVRVKSKSKNTNKNKNIKQRKDLKTKSEGKYISNKKNTSNNNINSVNKNIKWIIVLCVIFLVFILFFNSDKSILNRALNKIENYKKTKNIEIKFNVIADINYEDTYIFRRYKNKIYVKYSESSFEYIDLDEKTITTFDEKNKEYVVRNFAEDEDEESIYKRVFNLPLILHKQDLKNGKIKFNTYSEKSKLDNKNINYNVIEYKTDDIIWKIFLKGSIPKKMEVENTLLNSKYTQIYEIRTNVKEEEIDINNIIKNYNSYVKVENFS